MQSLNFILFSLACFAIIPIHASAPQLKDCLHTRCSNIFVHIDTAQSEFSPEEFCQFAFEEFERVEQDFKDRLCTIIIDIQCKPDRKLVVQKFRYSLPIIYPVNAKHDDPDLKP